MPELIASEIRDQFAVPQVGIKVWDIAPAFAHAGFAQGVSDDAKLFASSLMEPFCGVNTGFEAVSWLPDAQAAASLALLPLRMGPVSGATPAFGLLVLAYLTRSGSTAPWAPIFWRASPSWPAPRCRG